MKGLGILLIVISVAMWIATTGIITHILRDEFFKKLLILKGHRKMLIWIILLSALMLVLAFLGGKCA